MKIVNMDMALSRAFVEDKRESFRFLIKDNSDLAKFIIESKNKIHQELNSVEPVKKVSVANFRAKSAKTIEKWKEDSELTYLKKQVAPKNMNVRDLYKECVESLAKSLKSMKGSEDVQAGIYL
jgi:hypothetical protein